MSDFKIKLLSNSTDEKKDLINELQTRDILLEELDAIKTKISETDPEADNIRTAFIHVANGILKSFAQIKRWGDYYPDLNQGTVIPGHLFGKILNDFNIALKYEGGLPVVEIYMSQEKWDYEPLESLIDNIRNELVKASFTTKMEAIKYFGHIRKSILAIVEDLRKTRLI